MAKIKPDKSIWRLIEEDNYAKLEAINYMSNGNDDGPALMMPSDYPLVFDMPESITTAKEFFDYYFEPFFNMLLKYTSDALFKNGYRILKDFDELQLFWRSEMELDLNKPKK